MYIQSDSVKGIRPHVSPPYAGKVTVGNGKVNAGLSDLVPGTLYGLVILPAGCVPLDFSLIVDDLDTGTALTQSVGVLNDDGNDLVASTLLLTESTIGQGGGVARASSFPGALIAPSVVDRVIAVKNVTGGVAGVKATCKITSDETNVTAGKVVVVNGKTYTFVNDAPDAEGEVAIGDSATMSLANLAYAIGRNNPDVMDGVNYKVAAAHTTVAVKSLSPTVFTLEAIAAGAAGDAYTCTTDDEHLTVDADEFDGGVTAVPLQGGTIRGVLTYRAEEYGA